MWLGSSYETAKEGVDKMRRNGKKAGAVTLNVLRPFPEKELFAACKSAETMLVADRQDSYGAGGGNLSRSPQDRSASPHRSETDCGDTAP